MIYTVAKSLRLATAAKWETSKGRQRQLALDATSQVPLALWQTEAQQHKRKDDVASDVGLSFSCCPYSGADRNCKIAKPKRVVITTNLRKGPKNRSNSETCSLVVATYHRPRKYYLINSTEHLSR